MTNEDTYTPAIVDVTTHNILQTMESPRVISTHQAPELLPPDALMKNEKLIIIFQNPKDTAVSMFHHFRRGVIDSGKMELNCFIDNFMIGNSKYCYL